MADQPQVTSTESWIKDVTEGAALTVPSGHVALVRNPGLNGLMDAGLVPNALMPIVMDAIAKGRPPTTQDLTKDPSNLGAMMQMIDDTICYCVIEPKVIPVPYDENSDGSRSPRQDKKKKDVLYVDMVDLEDRLFIFQWVQGGTRDIARFREGLSQGVESLSSVQGSPGSPKRAGRPAPTKRTGAPAAKRPAKKAR